MAPTNCGDVTEDMRSQINYWRGLRLKRLRHKHLPDEMWLEILSRLPIKSLLISRSVCKLWRDFSFALENKIEACPLYVPTCGLLLLSFTFPGYRGDTSFSDVDHFFSYFCVNTREVFGIHFNSPDKDFIYPSGFERGLLSDLSFDFSVIGDVLPNFVANEPFTFVLHGGLLLVTGDDGISEIQNPATKQVHFVPKSPTVESHGFKHHHRTEVPGLIIQFPSHLIGPRCCFIVVRFCMNLKIIEVYYSVTRVWKKYPLHLQVEYLPLVRWRYQNYAVSFQNGVLFLYLLTNKDHGLTIKFKTQKNFEMEQYFFPLPEGYVWEKSTATIWECEGSIYLFDYDDTSLWIWKADSTEVDAWSWVTILEISRARRLCKPAAREHLLKVVLNASDRVVPLALDPNVSILYLLVNSSVFAYNLNKDTLERIGEISSQEYKSLENVHPYVPCLGFMEESDDW